MNHEQIKLLTKIKMLVKMGYKYFANRKDRNHVEDLAAIGISEKMVWDKYIMFLKPHDYIPDYKPTYRKDMNSLTFKRMINGKKVYIKLKIEEKNNHENAVCLSFHIDNRR